MNTLTHYSIFISPDLTPMKAGDTLMMNLVSILSLGLSALTFAAKVLPVTSTST
ncbi:MAG: hypothetical protein VYD85_16465 [Pseudomonadota bacterium]|nr:hypothetical protein [Pseudomonadota bacterium]